MNHVDLPSIVSTSYPPSSSSLKMKILRSGGSKDDSRQRHFICREDLQPINKSFEVEITRDSIIPAPEKIPLQINFSQTK